jgi:hypothetical protein
VAGGFLKDFSVSPFWWSHLRVLQSGDLVHWHSNIKQQNQTGKGVFMKANEVLRAFFKKHGVKRIADALGLSESFLYKWCQPDGGKATGGWNPLERIVALALATGDVALVQWLCQQVGGYFVRNPKGKLACQAELLPATGSVMQLIAHLQAELAEAVKDCRVTRAEAAEIRKGWEALKSNMEGFVQGCENNAFPPAIATARDGARAQG